jgi:hypothetical protein
MNDLPTTAELVAQRLIDLANVAQRDALPPLGQQFAGQRLQSHEQRLIEAYQKRLSALSGDDLAALDGMIRLMMEVSKERPFGVPPPLTPGH